MYQAEILFLAQAMFFNLKILLAIGTLLLLKKSIVSVHLKSLLPLVHL